MAVTLTNDGEWTFASFPIEKMETDENGDLYVYGKATDGAVDSDDQIVDPVWAAKAIGEWLSTGANLRVQHNPSRDPAGKGVEVTDDGRGGQWVKSLVVEPVAKNLVKKGVLQAYSVGIMRPVIVPDQLARNGRIVGGELGELSLVDRPANKGCRFELVKSFGGHAEFVGKMFGTDTLNKVYTTESDTVTVEVPKSAKIKVTPADLAKMLAKRDFDPSVGGGVDRDKIPDADFAGEHRSFPIVKPGDVSDAADSLGRARGQDTDTIKQRIISIANRKGPDFVAQLPDSWKDGGSTDTEDANKTVTDEELFKAADEKPAFPGAAKPFGKKDDADSDADDEDSDDEKDDQAKPEVTKASKDCPKCGATHHADSKLKRCEKCNAKLPKADDVTKGSKGTQIGDGSDEGSDSGGSEQDDDLDDSDDSTGGGSGEFDDKDDDSGKSEKAFKVKVPCPGCKKSVKVGNNFCPKCGGKMATADMAKKSEADRTEPTPADGVTGEHAEPVAAHREPDGEAIEAFEADAKLPTDPDARYKSLMYTKGLNIPDDMAALHDMLCPAYSTEAAHDAHPHASLKSVDVQSWRMRAFQAASGATLEEALAATKRLEHVSTLAELPDYLLDELHEEDHAAFKAINPEQSRALRPGSITPGSFRRPYIGSDARASFQQQGPNSGPGGFASIKPNDFERGFLTGGRADESPSSGNTGTTIPKPSTTGVPTRVNVGPAMKDNARQAMNAMHDHIAQTFPDLCPMHAPGDTGSRPVNPGVSPVGKTAEPETTKAATVSEAPVASDDLFGVDMLVKSFGPDIIKGAVAEALAPVLERLESTEAELKTQRKLNKSLKGQFEKLAALPDPNVAPFRGQAYDVVTKTSGTPVGVSDPAGIAARAQLLVQNELVSQSYSTDPTQREAALTALYKMRGIGS